MRRPYRKDTPGFTIIEVLMVIVLMGIIGAFVVSLLFQGTRSLDVMDTRVELTSTGEHAMERMAREVRRVRCTTVGVSCSPSATDITAFTSTELRFVNTDEVGRGFRLDGTDLKLRQGSGAGDPEEILAAGVGSFTIDYLADDGTTAVLVGDIWRITVNMTLTDGGESVSFRRSVHPRSFR